MTVPRSYSRHSLEFLINGLRDCLAREPDSFMAPRWRKSLERAEAELSELRDMMGETNARDNSVDGRGARRAGSHVAGWAQRVTNRKGARNG